MPNRKHIDILFDGPPGHDGGRFVSVAAGKDTKCKVSEGRFVEVEDAEGRSFKFGEWVQLPDGYWALRIEQRDFLHLVQAASA